MTGSHSQPAEPGCTPHPPCRCLHRRFLWRYRDCDQKQQHTWHTATRLLRRSRLHESRLCCLKLPAVQLALLQQLRLFGQELVLAGGAGAAQPTAGAGEGQGKERPADISKHQGWEQGQREAEAGCQEARQQTCTWLEGVGGAAHSMCCLAHAHQTVCNSREAKQAALAITTATAAAAVMAAAHTSQANSLQQCKAWHCTCGAGHPATTRGWPVPPVPSPLP